MIGLLPILAAGAVAGLIGLVLYVVVIQAEDRASARASLRALDGYDFSGGGGEASRRLGDRATEAASQSLIELAKKYTPIGYAQTARHKLTIAGRPSSEDLDRFLAIRIIGFATVPVWILTWWVFLPVFEGMLQIIITAASCAVGAVGPNAWLNRTMGKRQRLIRLALPDVLDLLTISVEAGLGFEQALDRVIASVPGPLSDEFNRMLGEMRAGSGRADALRALDERCEVPELKSFVLAIIQADTFGVSIGRILRGQADEMRVKRRQLAQEEAQKAPVKMLLPMVFCVFPSLFVVVLGPAIINIQESL